ncbi:MAG: hypothetical protein JNL35_00400 [Sphingopyxis sp.]|nr:hypothetical protein [Sphingopyxis sp.]
MIFRILASATRCHIGDARIVTIAPAENLFSPPCNFAAVDSHFCDANPCALRIRAAARSDDAILDEPPAGMRRTCDIKKSLYLIPMAL